MKGSVIGSEREKKGRIYFSILGVKYLKQKSMMEFGDVRSH
jgi:hypothetical protein